MSSQYFVANAVADDSDDPTLPLLTILHADLPEPIRLVANTVDIVSRGWLFTAFPFELTLPGASDGGDTPARLVIDNIDQRIVQLIRALSTPPSIIIEVIQASEPNVVEMSLPPMKIFAASADRNAVEIDLNGSGEDQAEALMQWECTPSLLPALH